MTEKEKMQAGEWYDATDADLDAERRHAKVLCHELNQTSPANEARREELLGELLGELGADSEVLGPFLVDYGSLVRIGEATFINHGAYLMDGGGITIGSHVQIGPNCGMYTAQHPIDAAERRTGAERALPIVVEDDVWIGGDVTILSGVTIGASSIVGAGSVVTKDVPAGSIAVGNPCRVIREVREDDRVGL